jgi:hypothetical protein
VQLSDFGNGSGLWGVAAGVAIILAVRLASRLFRRTAPGAGAPDGDRAAILALSEDLQRMITDERRGTGGEREVLAWNAQAYRMARTRLRTRNPALDVWSALSDLDEARADLSAAWRFSKLEPRAFPGDVEDALRTHAAAIQQFADAAAIFVRISWRQRPPDGAAV